VEKIIYLGLKERCFTEAGFRDMMDNFGATGRVCVDSGEL